MRRASLRRQSEAQSLKPTAVLVMCAIAIAALAAYAQPLAIQSIHAYQRAGAPIAARIGLRCRFNPTCSRYAEAVVTRDGVVRGGWKTVKRIARCGPWTPNGTRDDP
jgi:putative membrane protein insertion efficiency factor